MERLNTGAVILLSWSVNTEKEGISFRNLFRVMMIRVQIFILCPEVMTAMTVNE